MFKRKISSKRPSNNPNVFHIWERIRYEVNCRSNIEFLINPSRKLALAFALFAFSAARVESKYC